MSKDNKKQRALTVSALDYLHDAPTITKLNISHNERVEDKDNLVSSGGQIERESVESKAEKEKKVSEKTVSKVEGKAKATKVVEPNIEVAEQEKNAGGRPKKPERERFTLNVNKKYIDLVRNGRLEEKFKTDSDFLDHIFESYFKGKPYSSF